MKQATTSIFLGSVMATSLLTAGAAMAESPLTANIGVTSNYMWRGVTQSADQAAVSGGIDYAHDSGFYVGTWASNVTWTPGYEIDLYAGYGFDAGPVGLDLGYIQYMYPVGTAESDFGEVYANASWQWLSGGLAYTVTKEADTDKKNDIYYYLGAEFDVKDGLMLGATVGGYNFEDTATEDYIHYDFYLSKSDFTFSLQANDLPDSGAGEDDIRAVVSWSKGFDL